MAVPSSSTSYLIDGLTGLMLCEINVTAVTVKAGPSKMIKVLTNEGGRIQFQITLRQTESKSVRYDLMAFL